MTTYDWCDCQVDERKADVDGNHQCFTDCIGAQKSKIKALIQELIEERVLTASLTEQLEKSEICDGQQGYEENEYT